MSAAIFVPHFLRPEWGWALLGLPLVAWLWWRRPSASAWRGVVDPHLLPALLDAGTGQRRRRSLVLWLLGYSLAVAALAGPAWQQQPSAQWQTQAPLVVAVELSRGMLAADLPPSRLQRVRLKLAQLLDERAGGQIGLVAYAGEAFTVAPLTDDARTVRALLDPLDPALMPVDGRRADRAIAHAAALIRNAGFGRGDILLLASGSEGEAEAAARAAAAQGVRVSVIGIGTREGAPVRGDDGGFLSGRDGGLQLWALGEDELRALAAAGGGAYTGLRADAADLRAAGALDPRGERRAMDEAGTRRWQDAGYWLIVPLLALAMLAFRRGAFAAMVLAVAAVPRPAAAIDWAALWQRDDQRAQAALEAGDYRRARELAQDPALDGAAAYRMEDWETAAERWSQRDDARAHYNRGNALAKAGRYDDAIAAYDEALRRDPRLTDAAANRQAVREWLEQQPPESGEGGQGAPEPGEQPPGDRPPGDAGEDESAQGGESADEPAEGEPSDAPGDTAEGGAEPAGAGEAEAASDADTQAAAEAALREAMQRALENGAAGGPDEAADALDPAAEEQRRALEQWLRRVPDDPGGLLRRKFALEYQRRQSEREAQR